MPGKDLTGLVFTKLTVLKESSRRTKEGTKLWICQCSCHEKSITKVDTSSLNKGHTRSCGCLQKEAAIQWGKNRRTHGATIEGSRQLDYIIWTGIKQRCYDTNYHRYDDYGGRGIKVYRKWINNFSLFAKYIRTLDNCPPEKILASKITGKRLGLSIDRKNNNGNYEPGNLKWSTAKEQNNNKRNTIKVYYRGKERKLLDVVDKYSTNSIRLVRRRLKDGWSLEEALK